MITHGDDRFFIYNSDNMLALKELPDDSIDSIVTDPPYGIEFMNKGWDKGVPTVDLWEECLRVLKPGGHLLAFAGTRTQHRMASAIEDAGFEIRDMIAWVYGSGFPKSLDVSKAIDKAAGVERPVIGTVERWGANASGGRGNQNANGYQPTDIGARRVDEVTGPATEAAKQWDGWGTALKPALEPITVARKPFKATVAANVMEYGTGALNIDGCRVGDFQNTTPSGLQRFREWSDEHTGQDRPVKPQAVKEATGRFPANLIHDGSDEVVDLFPGTDDKNAARFFYCPKATKKDRDAGLEAFEAKRTASMNAMGDDPKGDIDPVSARFTSVRKNIHPTVKPTDLMAYLCRLVTQPGGTVLDPFMGSGSTGKAAMREGFRFVGMELSDEYFEIAKARIEYERSKS